MNGTSAPDYDRLAPTTSTISMVTSSNTEVESRLTTRTTAQSGKADCTEDGAGGGVGAGGNAGEGGVDGAAGANVGDGGGGPVVKAPTALQALWLALPLARTFQ